MPKPKKTTELIPDSRNMNKGNEYGASLINKSFSKFGAGRSILIDKNNKVIAGNKSLDACNAIGLTDLIVVETTGNQVVAVKRTDIDLDTPEGREMALADNATAKENIEWDNDTLAAISKEFGINTDDWGISMDELFPPDAEEDNYHIPVEIETDIQPGDIIHIGHHRLICGDATLPETYHRLLSEQQIDLVVTDPPYNVDYTGGTGLKIENDSMPDEQFLAFLSDFHNAIYPFIKPGGSVYVWHADSEGLNFRNAFKNSGLMMKQCLIWVKNSMVLGRQDYQWRHEPCLYGWKPGEAHYFINDRTNTTVFDASEPIELEKLKKDELMDLIKAMLAEFQQNTIIYHDKPNRSESHPTMKPVKLMAELIINSSRPNQLICDPFLGSGSTMVAAHQLKRRCYGAELDPKYCQVIVDRMIMTEPDIQILINGKRYEKPVQTPEEGD